MTRAAAVADPERCQASTTERRVQCSRRATEGGYCHQHSPEGEAQRAVQRAAASRTATQVLREEKARQRAAEDLAVASWAVKAFAETYNPILQAAAQTWTRDKLPTWLGQDRKKAAS